MDTHFLLFKGGENAADPGQTTALPDQTCLRFQRPRVKDKSK
jgi:hypothetical protein